jgi:hypothetical protein
MIIGLPNSGADLEFTITGETYKAYHLKDNLGNDFWLPKSVFREDGTLNEFGERLYEEKRGL